MVTIGVIGGGYWGKNLIRVFSSLGSARLKYIADTNPTMLSQYTGYSNIITTLDYHDILNDSTVNAVVVSTPPVTHYEIVHNALISQKHVFVEKPMTLKRDHAVELTTTAEQKNLKLMVGHLLLYHPCITVIKEYIECGDIGDVYYLYSHRLNLGKVRQDENALLSFAPHDISVAVYLMGEEPYSVNAFGQSYLQDGIEDVVFLTMNFSKKKIAHIHVSWLDPHKIRRLTVVGSRKMVVFDDMESSEKIRVYDKGVDKNANYNSYDDFLSLRDGNIYIPSLTMSEPLKIECEHFIDCIVHNRTPKSDGRNGLLVTSILEAGQESLKAGGSTITL